MDEDALTATTRVLYPDADAFEKDMPRLLQKMGFDAIEENEGGVVLAMKL